MGQTEGMVTPRCAASATWNPHVDVKGLEDAAGTGLWQCRRGRTGRYVEGPGASIGCRQETGTPRRAASATCNSQCEEGEERG